MRSPREFFDHVKTVGFYPQTIIDVGVARGTPDIYKAFPEAYYVLVDPVREYEPELQRILTQLRGEYHLIALSDQSGTRDMLVPDPLYISTFQYDGSSIRDRKNIRSIPTLTLAELVSKGEYRAPILLKTDCQGHDLDVIKGGGDCLEAVEMIICELPVYGPWGGGDELTDYIRDLDDLGYRFYDVWGWLYREGDRRLQNMDLVFVKTNGRLRRNRLFTQGRANVGGFTKED
jgi:FkbM family methyltransferase